MQRCYISSRYSPTVDEWPPYQPRHYTTLALIHHKNKCTDATVISVTQELAVAGKFQHKEEGLSSGGTISRTPNIYSNTTKNISSIFVSVTASDGLTINPCIILIEGAPGIGKTVLAKEIAFQWANNKLLGCKKILLLLFLRECDFKNMKSIENLVEHVVKSNKIPACLAEYLLQTEGKDLTLVFDGYDEVSEEDRKNSVIADIIYRRIFSKCCLVITSRPTASSNLHSIVDCRAEIVGFTEEDRLDYIQTALQGNDDKVKALTLYLQSNPTINALCYIPLNMTILLCLVENGMDKLPKTQTDMYKQFIEMTIVRFIQKSSMKYSIIINDIANLPDPYNKVFKELAQLAYKTLKIDKIVFTLNEVEMACPNLTMTSSNWNGLGLLKAVRHFEVGNNCVTFHFLHFSIQEYMAAWYISALSNKKQIKLLKKIFWLHRYYNTWIMHIGITGGSSFPLKHFLSGSWFQFTTKMRRTSSISNKYLKHKIKCLHLFQCLTESSNEEMIASVSKFFQNGQIDLSNQTLLPSDISTLGFFLLRSIDKQWEMLSLAGCNIGSIGSNILCDGFLNNDSRNLITINKIDFSHNQLNFSSLTKLLSLFKHWHTSDITIIDSGIIHDSSEIYAAIEDGFFYKANVQATLQFKSFLFAQGINIGSNMSVSENMYLHTCEWVLTGTRQFIVGSLTSQIFGNIHLINLSCPLYYISGVCTALLNNAARNTGISNYEGITLFIYNPALSDEDANVCSFSILSKMPYGVMLFISKSKIQGIINVVDLTSKLSKLELLNLIRNIRIIHFEHLQTYPWKQDLCCNGSKSELIINTFVGLLYRIICNHSTCHLRIALQEKDTLIAYNVNLSVLKNILHNKYEPIRAIYLNDCDIILSSQEYETLCCHDATKIYICKSLVHESFISKILCASLSIKETFIHSLSDIDSIPVIPSDPQRCSIVFVTKKALVGYKPTTEQISLALQLEPSISVLKLYNCQENFDVFDQLVRILATTTNSWAEFDFVNCTIGKIECEILYEHLKMKKCLSTVKTVKISVDELHTSLSKLDKIVLLWKVEDLFFYGINHAVINCFIKNICTTDNTSLREIFLSVTYNNKRYLFCNLSWERITSILKTAKLHFSTYNLQNFLQLDHTFQIYIILHKNVWEPLVLCISCDIQLQELNISDNHLQPTSAIIISKILQGIFTLRKLNISKNKITEEAADDIAAAVSCNTKLEELDISDNNLQAIGTITISKALQGISTLTKLYISKNNITDEAADDIGTAISCNTQLQELDISDNDLEATGSIKIIKPLQGISTLTKLYIGKNDITDKAADDIAVVVSCNTKLEELDISDNDLQAVGTITISKALQGISTLTKLYISKNNITEKAADDIAADISCNTQLQELDISDNDLGTTGSIKIIKALQGISTLTKLYIGKNNITVKAADDIAATIFCNTQLQELDISDNNLQTSGAIIISKALQDISTLTKLCLSNNIISDKAADDIAAALANNNQLQEFDMGLNKFTSSGITSITKALCTNTNVRVLVIKDNYRITDNAAYSIAAAVNSNTKLQIFNFSRNCYLSTIGITEIAKSFQSVFTLTKLNISKNNIIDDAADDIAVALSCNVQLQELDISINNLQTPGTVKIAKALQQISTLQKLYINDNFITASASDDIAAVCSSNAKLQELDFSKNQFTVAQAYKLYKHCKSLNNKVITQY